MQMIIIHQVYSLNFKDFLLEFVFLLVCWSPKGKQIVVVKFDGALELYEPTMKLKKTYASTTLNHSFPPCISVLWLSTSQFLLGFSEDSPEENTNDNTFFQILVTYDKVRRIDNIKIYLNFFFIFYIGSTT